VIFVTLTEITMTAKTKPTPAAAFVKLPGKPPGRPPTGSRAMTGAERQAALRRRQREAEMAAYGNPAGKPTRDVLKALTRQLAQLDDPEQAQYHPALRDMAERALGEVCSRYKLKPRTSR
jgi:hypothetical protein